MGSSSALRLGVVVVSDRGDLYLPECLDNLRGFLPDVSVFVVDDQDHHLGMAGAVRYGMAAALNMEWEYVLWVEEDFRFNVRPPIEQMALILDRDQQCAQVVLKRQPWSVEEEQAGGIVEMNPDDYTEYLLTCSNTDWMEHTRIFSMNPCLIPRRILELGYPDGNEAEQTARLVQMGYHFAMYGKRNDPPLVHHVGHQHVKGWRL